MAGLAVFWAVSVPFVAAIEVLRSILNLAGPWEVFFLRVHSDVIRPLVDGHAFALHVWIAQTHGIKLPDHAAHAIVYSAALAAVYLNILLVVFVVRCLFWGLKRVGRAIHG